MPLYAPLIFQGDGYDGGNKKDRVRCRPATCRYYKDHIHALSELFLRYCNQPATLFNAGVSNLAPGERLSCRLQIQPCSNIFSTHKGTL